MHLHAVHKASCTKPWASSPSASRQARPACWPAAPCRPASAPSMPCDGMQTGAAGRVSAAARSLQPKHLRAFTAAGKRPADCYGCTLTWFDSCHPMAHHAAVVCCIGCDAVARKCFKAPAALFLGLTELSNRVHMLQAWVFVIQAPLSGLRLPLTSLAACKLACFTRTSHGKNIRGRGLKTWSLWSCARVGVLCIPNTRVHHWHRSAAGK